MICRCSLRIAGLAFGAMLLRLLRSHLTAYRSLTWLIVALQFIGTLAALYAAQFSGEPEQAPV